MMGSTMDCGATWLNQVYLSYTNVLDRDFWIRTEDLFYSKSLINVSPQLVRKNP